MLDTLTVSEAEIIPNGGLQAITYPVTDSAIVAKRAQYAALKADTPAGYESVRLAIADCRMARVAIEKRRKELKADSLEFGRRVDLQAKTLTSLLEQIEQPLQLMKDAVDEEKERKRLEAERIERERVEAEIRVKREAEEAEAKRLRDIEEARLAEERERLAAAERAMAAERERIRVEAETLAAQRAAEDKRQSEERARIEAERRKLEDERLAAACAEAERIARIAAEEEAKAKAQRERVAAEEAKRQAEIRAAEHAAELQALKSDAAKFSDLADAIDGIAIPKVKAAASKRRLEEARAALQSIATSLREVAK